MELSNTQLMFAFAGLISGVLVSLMIIIGSQ